MKRECVSLQTIRRITYCAHLTAAICACISKHKDNRHHVQASQLPFDSTERAYQVKSPDSSSTGANPISVTCEMIGSCSGLPQMAKSVEITGYFCTSIESRSRVVMLSFITLCLCSDTVCVSCTLWVGLSVYCKFYLTFPQYEYVKLWIAGSFEHAVGSVCLVRAIYAFFTIRTSNTLSTE